MGETRQPSSHDEERERPHSGSAPSELVEQLAAHAPKTSRYTLEGEIARGGMGAIVKVWDEDLRRHLAMKVVLGEAVTEPTGDTPAVDERTLGRFLEEAQVTGQLDHPGVVPVHELGVDATGRVYFTMRLVKGRDLKEVFGLVRHGAEGWSQTRALNVLLKACEALAYAHDKSVVHRDLKPSNIMVGRFGEVYVMDWGLARVLGHEDKKDIRLKPQAPSESSESVHTLLRDVADETPDSPLVTMDGDVVGTPVYMSPEQARGEVEEIDARSDVYAMGAILYELLTGQMPYVPPGERRSARTILNAVLSGPPEPVHSLATSVPAELEAICEKAMARTRERRYASVVELAEDLRAFLEGRVVKAYRTGAVVELRKWVGRNKGLAAASLLAVVFLAGGFAVSSALFVGEREQRERADKSVVREAEAREKAEASARHARRQTYVVSVRAAAQSLASGNVAEARRRLEECPDEHRSWEHGHLELLRDMSIRSLVHEGAVRSVEWSPDGSRLASESVHWRSGPLGFQALRLWDATSGDALPVLQSFMAIEGVRRLSADWSRLAVQSTLDGALQTYELESQQPLAALGGFKNGGFAQSGLWSPDGRRIAIVHDDEALRIWDATNGKLLTKLAGQYGPDWSAAWSPSGNRLASASARARLQVWDSVTEEVLFESTGFSDRVPRIAWDPDGHRIALGRDDGTLRIRDAVSGEVLVELGGLSGGAPRVSWSPDGSRIALGFDDGSLRIRDAANGEVLVELAGHSDRVTSVAWSHDARRVASGSWDGKLRLWDVVSGKGLVELTGHEDTVTSVAWRPDGLRLASSSTDGTVRIWDAASEAGVAELTDQTRNVTSIVWNPDGHSVASRSLFGTLTVWDAATGDTSAVMTGMQGEISWSPDGRYLTAGSREGTLQTWAAETGETNQVPAGHDGRITHVKWSPDGSQLASGDDEGVVRIHDAESGESIAVHVRHDRSVRSLAWSPDGSRLAVGGANGIARIWDVAGREILVVLRDPNGSEARVSSLAWSPDGSQIAAGLGNGLDAGSRDGILRIFDAKSGEELAALVGHEGELLSLAWSPDGRRLASGDQGGTLRLWDVDGAEAVLELTGHEGGVQSLAWSPDGKRLASGDDYTLRVWESEREASRRMAAAADRRWRVRPLVEGLFDELIWSAEVVAALEAEADLGHELRLAAVRMARSRLDPSAWGLNSRAWAVGRTPDASAQDLERAVRWARAACTLEPQNERFLNTLGIVQYRMGEYANALATLTRADGRNAVKDSYPRVKDLLFIVMARIQLGDHDEAAEMLEDLRSLTESEKLTEEVAGYFAEADALIENLSIATGVPTAERPD